jgi:2-keto-4-pentenoate hydratase/2-oxohepta-3-ene-1,7-dioic acid hydratase in catechol pathway
MWLDLNGARQQTGTTATMIFGVAELVSYCSHFNDAVSGDLISTGTPPRRRPRQEAASLPEAGDEMRLGIEGPG